MGTPVGYADAQGLPHSNPPPHATVMAQALFVLVDETQKPTNAVLQRLLDGVQRQHESESTRAPLTQT